MDLLSTVYFFIIYFLVVSSANYSRHAHLKLHSFHNTNADIPVADEFSPLVENDNAPHNEERFNPNERGAVCGDTPTVNKGTVSPGSSLINARREVVCDHGHYPLNGEDHITCKFNGNWENNVICEECENIKNIWCSEDTDLQSKNRQKNLILASGTTSRGRVPYSAVFYTNILVSVVRILMPFN